VIEPSRHHPRRRRLAGFGYFKRLGPGLVTGASDDDPSGIGTYSQVGAAFRFGLLWTAVVCLPLASAVQEVAARLGLVTGQGLAALIRGRFPRIVLYGAVSLVVGANVFNIGADLGSMAASMRLLVPIPYAPLVVAITVVVLALEVFVSYQRYSKILRWLTISLVSYIVVLFIVRVNWRAVTHATFLPKLQGDRSYIAALIAVFGTTISPYLFFWQSSEEVEEEHSRQDAVDSGHLRAMRVDVVSGMVSAVMVMFAIQVAAAATLGAHGATTIQTADQAARALQPLAGRLASLLFAAGIVGTGALAVPVLAGSTAYALSEAFRWREGLWQTFRTAPGFYAIISGSMFVGLALGFVGLNPIRALYLSAILNGLAAPPLILLMLILANSKATMGGRTSGSASNLFMGLALLIMAGLPIAYLVR
jgi:NRAMP (natural resistance-associated macrophage protein)-like metal ion transporter